jgi:hypothetical protein
MFVDIETTVEIMAAFEHAIQFQPVLKTHTDKLLSEVGVLHIRVDSANLDANILSSSGSP